MIELIKGVLWIRFYDFITMLTEVNLLLITIYVGIQMDTSFIKVTVLAEHISTSFYLSWERPLFENILVKKGQIYDSIIACSSYIASKKHLFLVLEEHDC